MSRPAIERSALLRATLPSASSMRELAAGFDSHLGQRPDCIATPVWSLASLWKVPRSGSKAASGVAGNFLFKLLCFKVYEHQRKCPSNTGWANESNLFPLGT